MKKLLYILFVLLCFGQVEAQYCTPSGTFSACAFGLNDFWITSVSFTGTGSTFNYTGGACVGSAPYYQNTGYTADVVAGNTYTLTLGRAGQTYKTYFNVWVDWNNNNVLNDATENIAVNLLKPAAGGLTATVTVTIPLTATPGIHRMRVRSQYNITNANNPCLTTGQAETKDFNLNVVMGCTTPSTQASAASVGSISYSSANINWTPGNGTGGDIVFLKQGSAITTDPVNTTTYTANSVFGSGMQIGTTGAYAIYSGFGGTTPITTLLPGTTYYYSIYTFDAAGPCYKTPTITTGSFTTLSCSSPTTQASAATTVCIENNALNLKFTRGNGNKVIVLAKAGSAVDADPVYNTFYTASLVFGSGSQIGTGNYVVYDGSDPGTVLIHITGLTAGITYYFKIYEYNTPNNCYNTVSPATASGTARAPGTYVSSTTTQNTANVSPGSLAADIVKLTIVISGGEDMAATLNSITFTTTGSTNTGTDITNAKIFYTGNSNTFSNATQYGTTFTSFGTNTAIDTFALKVGNNYFWIAYDVKSTATNGDVLDATVTSINVTDNISTANRIPTVTAPAGSRPISVPASLVFCSGVTPTATCAGTGCNFSCSQGEQLSSISIVGATVLSFSGWPCNSTCGTNTNSYTDMFLLNKYSMNQGTTHNMSIVFSTWFSMQMNWVIWVDWNQDGVFTNASPERFPATGSIDEWTSQNIIVPASVSSGRHRARLWMQEFSYPPTTPCRTTSGPLTTSIGQIVDFDIEVPDGSLEDLDPAVIAGGISCATLVPIVTTPVNYTLGDTPSQLTATGSGLLWYTSPTGGVGSTTAPTPTTSTTGTQTYYVSQNNGSCEGPRTQIVVNVYPLPPLTAPIANVTQPTCLVATGSVELTGLPVPGTWTIYPNGITGTGSSNVIAPVAPGTYNYYYSDAFDCISPSSANAVVNPQPITPSAPIVSTVTQPAGAITTGSVLLTGLPVDGWILNPGGIVGGVGVTSYTVSGLLPGTYTFTVTNSSGCVSNATILIDIILPLPVELLQFNAEYNGKEVELKWSTASEKNNDYFTVEKSINTDNYVIVRTVDGAGNSSSFKQYHTKDPDPYVGISYYRLKQTDYDQNYSYSKIIPIVVNNKLSLEIISINQESEHCYNAFVRIGNNSVVTFQILNITGKIIYSSQYNYITENVTKIRFDTQNFEKGIYLIKVIDSSDTKVKKFIIY